MALFIISWLDKPGALDIRLATREAHLAYVADHPGVVRLGGPYLSEDGAMAGSMLIVEAEDLGRIIAALTPGETVELVVVRDGSRETIEIELGERPTAVSQP